ncbi:hypothetical protein ACLF3G_06970 [Falsiroseomonas sp. HC035]|uniref:hypothetical protein n=1 Tax=Falsiroseomonas sp. HC035 TaxID=3390999 RepID=UPI003D3200BB
MRFRALLLPLSLLAACATQDPADPALLLQEALASHQASLSGISPHPAAAGGEGSAARPAAAGHPPVAQLGGSLPAMAGQVVGHGPAAVTSWFGEPRLRREEGSAEIWHYQAEQCHLDLVLYRDEAPGGGLRVAFAAARAVGTARRGETACLRDIARGGAPAT